MDCMGASTSQGREILRTEGLWKQYGRITAVADMQLQVFDSEVYSFLGPNGSGKSTTVGMILGLVRPTKGRAVVFGSDMATHPWPALRNIGAVIETPAFYPYLSGYDNLRTLAIMLGDISRARIEEGLVLVGLRGRGRAQYLRLRADDNEALARALGGIPWVEAVDRVDGFVRAEAPVAKSAELNQVLASKGVYLSELTPWEVELESVFLDLTGDEAT